MDRPLRFGLFGAGGVGAFHLAALRRLEAYGQVEVVAIADPLESCRVNTLAAGTVDDTLPWYSRYQDLLEGGHNLDAVTVATPIPFHYEMTSDSLDQGLYVHLEKPPVPLIQQLDSLIARDVGRKVSVGFQFITSRCMRVLKKLVVDGALGPIRSIRAIGCWPRFDNYYSRAPWGGRMLLDGRPVFDGPATNALAHLVHNVMHLASPTSTGYSVPLAVAGEVYRARPIESYDCACLKGTFPSGIEFSIAVTHASRTMMPFRLRVEGEHGWAMLSADGERLETSEGLVIHKPETTQELINHCYERLTMRIASGGVRVATRLEDTVPYVRTTNAMYLSSGGIHDVDTAHVEMFEKDGTRGYHLRGICEALEEVMESGRMFSEMSVPWASAHPQTIPLDSFSAFYLGEQFEEPARAKLAVG